MLSELGPGFFADLAELSMIRVRRGTYDLTRGHYEAVMDLVFKSGRTEALYLPKDDGGELTLKTFLDEYASIQFRESAKRGEFAESAVTIMEKAKMKAFRTNVTQRVRFIWSLERTSSGMVGLDRQ